MPKPKSPSLTLDQFAAHGVLVSPRWYADPALAHELRGHWRINRDGYVERSEHGGGKTLLHRLIHGATLRDGRLVDHKNRNRLDCRDDNLIFVTPAASARNRDRAIPCLTFDRQRNRWELRTPTAKFGRRVRLGRFKMRPEAVARWECFSRHGALCECWKLASQPVRSRPEARPGVPLAEITAAPLPNISPKRFQEEAAKKAREQRYLKMLIAMSRSGATLDEMKRAVEEAKLADEQGDAEGQQATGTDQAAAAMADPYHPGGLARKV